MRTFLIKTIPYLLIALAYVLWGEYHLWINRENIPLVQVAEHQINAPQERYYSRQILGNSLARYKKHMMMRKQPNILVLGQSVALQFRDFMFTPANKDFYNTGLMVRNVQDLHYVADLIQDGDLKAPQWIILAVDMTFFQADFKPDEAEGLWNPAPDRALEVSSHLKGMQRLLRTPEIRQRPPHELGYGRAGMHGIGYRRDGSYRHEYEVRRYLEDSTYQPGAPMQHFVQRTGPFAGTLEYDSTKAQQLLQALDRFAAAQVQVTLYFPPLADQFYPFVRQDSAFAAFWDHYLAFQTTCQHHNRMVIPWCTPSMMGLTDDYMVDADHPGEVMVGLQLQQWYLELDPAQRSTLPPLTFATLQTQQLHPDWIPLSWMTDSLDQAAALTVRTAAQ
jgi:hypothetical protein